MRPQHRHFRRAADSCHVSQPTLSGQIRKLEDELGVMLLERTSRKVLFTQAGMLLVDQARTVLREVKVLKEMASQQGETMSGPLHIGLIPTVGPYLLPHIIPMLHQTFPKPMWVSILKMGNSYMPAQVKELLSAVSTSNTTRNTGFAEDE